MKLTHAEWRLYNLIKQYPKKHPNFYQEKMQMNPKTYLGLKWRLNKKNLIICKKKKWLDINPTININDD